MLVLERKIKERILVERAGASFWLSIIKLGTDKHGKPSVLLGIEGNPTDFIITRQELLEDRDEKLEAEVESLLAS